MKNLIITSQRAALFIGCLLLSAMFTLSAKPVQEPNLIPLPQKYKMSSGTFTVNPETKIVLKGSDSQMQDAVAVFNDLLMTAAGYQLPVTDAGSPTNAITCSLNPKLKNDEAYTLSIKKNSIKVEAKTPQGVFYAMQTLRQLLPPQIEGNTVAKDVKWTIPCMEIKDAPRFVYRGLHLDVCRHFTTKEDVKRFIDLLAYHKMNTFHWHLTDDQGWRIEIKKYPKLTTVGGFRNRTLKGAYVSADKRQWDNTRYGGFYTQEDAKEVIAYAAKRFITVIPEIELPGHAVAALTAYPQFSCSGGPFEVEGLWGVFNDIFCPREETFTFLQDILTEVAELFPSKYIHIGGDEAPKVRWERCHACQERIKAEGLKDEHELQSYVIKRIEKFMSGKGKRIIGWDEILEGGLAPEATVMSWRGIDGGIAAAKQKHDVIMTPNSHAYLDYYQAKPTEKEPHGIGGYVPLWKTYSFNPTPAELTPEEAKHILGFQGNIWCEYIHTFDHVLYMAYPRGAAIAEVGWTPNESKDYGRFQTRLLQVMKHYDAMGINYNKTFLSDENNPVKK